MVMQHTTYNIEKLRREEFPHSHEIAYLNHAGISPLPQRSQAKVHWIVEQLGRDPVAFWTNECMPAGIQLRERLAQLVNADSPAGLALTTTTSAALNAVALALPLSPGDNVIFCDMEFPSNAFPWLGLERDGIEPRAVPAQQGGLTVEAVESAADEKTRVVAVSAI